MNSMFWSTILIFASIPGPTAAATAQKASATMLVYPPLQQGGTPYVIRVEDGRIGECKPLDAQALDTPATHADCDALKARGLPAGLLPARSKSSPVTWVTVSDYPASALRDHRGGEVEFLFEVGTDGKVSNCRIYRSSGNADIDGVVCPLIARRARFTPATYKGNPVPSVRIDRFRMWTQ